MPYVSRWAELRHGFRVCFSVLTGMNAASTKKIKNTVLKTQGFVLSLSEGKTLLL